jgi:hypothetical protein
MSPAVRQQIIAVLLPALATLTLYGVFLGRSRQADKLKRQDAELQQAVSRADMSSKLEAARARLRGLEKRRAEAAALLMPSAKGPTPTPRLNAAQVAEVVSHLTAARLVVRQQQPLDTPVGTWAFDLIGEYAALVGILDQFAAGDLPGAPLVVAIDDARPGSALRRIYLEVTP